MPWSEMSPMDQRVQFVTDARRGQIEMTTLCAQVGISRKTGYKWLERYEHGGPAALCLSACTAEGPPQVRADDRWCTHRYLTDGEEVPVCATLPLEASQLDRLARQLSEVKALYPSFASSCGVPFDPRALEPPTVHVLRYEEINDRSAFPREESVGNILGRYYVGRSSVFITDRALDELGGDVRGRGFASDRIAHQRHFADQLTGTDLRQRSGR